MAINSIFSMIINAALESASQPPIKTPFYTIPSQFHVLITLPFGFGKSSLLSQVNPLPKTHFLTDCSLPGLIGSITRDGELVKGAVTRCGNGLLILDEAHRLTKQATEALNSFLTHGHHSRSLGFTLKKTENKIGSLRKLGWEVIPSESGFKVYARFSCLWLGERIYRHHEDAFLSRFFPLLLQPEHEDAFRFMQGEPILEWSLLQQKFKQQKKEMICPKECFEYLGRQIESICQEIKFNAEELGYVIRGNVHMIQLAAHNARNEGRNTINQQDCEKVINLGKILLQGYKLLRLTPFEMKILNYISEHGYHRNSIATSFCVDPAYVTRHVHHLQRMHLISGEVPSEMKVAVQTSQSEEVQRV